MVDEPKAPTASRPQKPIGKPSVKPPAKLPDKPDEWLDPLREALEELFPSAISDPVIYRGQPSITVAKNFLVQVCEYLRDDSKWVYQYPVDVTAVDYPLREKRFEVVYHIYSFEQNRRLRLKVLVADGETLPSLSAVWAGVDWQEREVFDMFGVVFEGHPKLKRILLPEGWVGHPLRKDYDILKQDENWVRENLHIESNQ